MKLTLDLQQSENTAIEQGKSSASTKVLVLDIYITDKTRNQKPAAIAIAIVVNMYLQLMQSSTKE